MTAFHRFAAEGRPWATMLVAGAMGVRQDFYAPYSRYLARNGIHVLTFDYRAMGESRPKSLRGFECDVSTWGEQDLDAMLEEARRADPSLPLLFLGHSLGGQLLPIAASSQAVRAAVTVTAGSGYYKLNDRMPAQVRIFWFLAIPLLTPLFGFFPGKKLRMVGDLPRGVAWQWRRWCLHPDYLLSESPRYREAFDRMSLPILSYSFEDDPIITRAGIESLHDFYRNAAVERRHVSPGEIRAPRIGHFGFFAPSSENTLWRESLEWLRSAAETD